LTGHLRFKKGDESPMMLDVNTVRQQFPALRSNATFFDNPGGTQVPQQVLDRILGYLTATNANLGGAFHTSIESDQLLDRSLGRWPSSSAPPAPRRSSLAPT
jgi:hypothetical protein